MEPTVRCRRRKAGYDPQVESLLSSQRAHLYGSEGDTEATTHPPYQLRFPSDFKSPFFLSHVREQVLSCPHLSIFERLFGEFSELQVDLEFCELTFRNPSSATLEYRMGCLADERFVGKGTIGGLPFDSVRRLTVNNIRLSVRQRFEITLLAELLQKLFAFLEYLELEGECDDTIRWLLYEAAWIRRKHTTPDAKLQTLIIRCGEHDGDRAYRLKCLALDEASLATTVICIPDPTTDIRKEV